MTFVDDIADDCDGFDATQTVLLTMLDDDTQYVAAVTSTKLNKQQTQLAGMLGLDSETRSFSLPVSNLSGETPEQDCRIRDASGAVWKIVSAELATVGTRYRCLCVKTRMASRLTSYTGEWTEQSSGNSPGYVFMAVSVAPTLAITINMIDSDGADRTSDLEAIQVGWTIQLSHADDSQSFTVTGAATLSGKRLVSATPSTGFTIPTVGNSVEITWFNEP